MQRGLVLGWQTFQGRSRQSKSQGSEDLAKQTKQIMMLPLRFPGPGQGRVQQSVGEDELRPPSGLHHPFHAGDHLSTQGTPAIFLRKHWDDMGKENFLSLIVGEPLCGLGRSTFWTDAPSGYSYYRVDTPCSSGFKFLCSDFFDDSSIRSHCTNYTRRKGRLAENLQLLRMRRITILFKNIQGRFGRLQRFESR